MKRDSSIERRRRFGLESVAKDLREFGYPDVTAAMVEEIVEAWKRGDRPLPHGVIGKIVGGRLDEAKGEKRP